MPRRRSPVLTEAELRLMRVLWRQGPSTVAGVREGLETPPLAYNSVLTTLRILEDKGFVRHEKDGRAFIYEATVVEDAAQSGAVKQLVGRFFEGSTGRLVAHLLDRGELDAETVERLRAMIDGKPS